MSLRPAPQSLPALSRFAHTVSVSAASSSRVPLSPAAAPSSAPAAARVYTPRKTFLYNYYDHLLRRSDLVLLFSHDNLSVSHLLKIRRAIAAIKPPQPAFDPSTPSGSAPASPENATLTILRSGILSALAKTQPAETSLLPFLSGPTALLTCPSLSPMYLSKVLLTIQKVIKSSQKDERPDQSAPKQPQMKLVAGVLEGRRLVGVQELEQVKELPELHTLRAQLVGMLEGQGRSLVGLLGQAAGGGLVRTLQGLEKDLQEKEGGASA